MVKLVGILNILNRGEVMTKTKQVLDLIKIRAGVDDAWMWRWIGINFKAIYNFYDKDDSYSLNIYDCFDENKALIWQLVIDLAPKLWIKEIHEESVDIEDRTVYESINLEWEGKLYEFVFRIKESDRLDWLIENLA